MKYRITHITEFIYASKAGLCYNEARLLPRELPHQRVLSSRLDIEPEPDDFYERLDYFGNRTVYFSVQQPHTTMKVTASSVVETDVPTAVQSKGNLAWEVVRDRLRSDCSQEVVSASQFILASPMVSMSDDLLNYAQPSFPPGRPLVEAVDDLMQRIYQEFKYDPEFSTIATPLKEVMKHRSGVCQDFAHLAIGCVRSLGLSARYVSGYIETLPPPGKERLIGADASHAWFSVFLPDFGWIDFDPTNNQLLGDRHITTAWGRDFADVTPLKGIAYGSGKHKLKVSVDVLPLNTDSN